MPRRPARVSVVRLVATLLGDFVSDVRHASRALARSPGFTVAAVVTLAFGIGANTAVFSVVNALLLQPLQFRDADRMVRIVEVIPGGPDRTESPQPPFRESIPVSELLQLPKLTRSIAYADAYGTSVETRFGEHDYAEVRGASVCRDTTRRRSDARFVRRPSFPDGGGAGGGGNSMS